MIVSDCQCIVSILFLANKKPTTRTGTKAERPKSSVTSKGTVDEKMARAQRLKEQQEAERKKNLEEKHAREAQKREAMAQKRKEISEKKRSDALKPGVSRLHAKDSSTEKLSNDKEPSSASSRLTQPKSDPAKIKSLTRSGVVTKSTTSHLEAVKKPPSSTRAVKPLNKSSPASASHTTGPTGIARPKSTGTTAKTTSTRPTSTGVSTRPKSTGLTARTTPTRPTTTGATAKPVSTKPKSTGGTAKASSIRPGTTGFVKPKRSSALSSPKKPAADGKLKLPATSTVSKGKIKSPTKAGSGLPSQKPRVVMEEPKMEDKEAEVVEEGAHEAVDELSVQIEVAEPVIGLSGTSEGESEVSFEGQLSKPISATSFTPSTASRVGQIISTQTSLSRDLQTRLPRAGGGVLTDEDMDETQALSEDRGADEPCAELVSVDQTPPPTHMESGLGSNLPEGM